MADEEKMYIEHYEIRKTTLKTICKAHKDFCGVQTENNDPCLSTTKFIDL